MKTTTPKPAAPSWILIDADGQAIGRVAATIAHLLRGKHRPTFTPHQVCGDHVVVINAAKLSIPQKKLLQKQYRKHTGYFGHLRSRSLKDMMENSPTTVIERAVKCMLPSNRLRPQLLKRLHVFPTAEHSHTAQQPTPFPPSPDL